MKDWFRLPEHRTDVRTELIGGLTTFLTAAYIIFVNPDILSQTGMDKGALITVTCLVSGLSTWLMGLWANAPYMMAPGMGRKRGPGPRGHDRELKARLATFRAGRRD